MFERADYAVVADPVFPEPAPGSLQTPSDLAWIVQICDALAEKSHDSSLDSFVELFQFFYGCGIELNLPSHSGALLLRWGSFWCAPNEWPPGASRRGRCLRDRPDVGEWLRGHSKFWCVPCAWRGGRGVFRWFRAGGWRACHFLPSCYTSIA